ncbi:hypothetical protein VUR80DRAFT_8407 [Thermomyces stellatus]
MSSFGSRGASHHNRSATETRAEVARESKRAKTWRGPVDSLLHDYMTGRYARGRRYSHQTQASRSRHLIAPSCALSHARPTREVGPVSVHVGRWRRPEARSETSKP